MSEANHKDVVKQTTALEYLDTIYVEIPKDVLFHLNILVNELNTATMAEQPTREATRTLCSDAHKIMECTSSLPNSLNNS